MILMRSTAMLPFDITTMVVSGLYYIKVLKECCDQHAVWRQSRNPIPDTDGSDPQIHADGRVRRRKWCCSKGKQHRLKIGSIRRSERVVAVHNSLSLQADLYRL